MGTVVRSIIVVFISIHIMFFSQNTNTVRAGDNDSRFQNWLTIYFQYNPKKVRYMLTLILKTIYASAISLSLSDAPWCEVRLGYLVVVPYIEQSTAGIEFYRFPTNTYYDHVQSIRTLLTIIVGSRLG